MTRISTIICVFAIMCSFALPSKSMAEYPERPIKILVPWSAGGGADLIIRLVEKEFKEEFGQPLVFIYRTGANGAIAATEIKNAKPDGYTLVSHSEPNLSSNIPTKKGDYTLDDFTFIAQTAKDPVFLAVRKDSPINTLDDFIKAAKEKKMLVGCIDFYGPTNFAALKMHKMGVPFIISSMGGGTKTVAALLGGHVDAAFVITGTSMSSLSEMKPLAVAAAERSPNLPNVPTFKELGWDIENSLSRFWMGPKLPAEVEARLYAGLKKIYTTPELRERAANAGLPIDFLAGPELEKNIKESLKEFEILIKYGESIKDK